MNIESDLETTAKEVVVTYLIVLPLNWECLNLNQNEIQT
jgi:hypothetical protein